MNWLPVLLGAAALLLLELLVVASLLAALDPRWASGIQTFAVLGSLVVAFVALLWGRS